MSLSSETQSPLPARLRSPRHGAWRLAAITGLVVVATAGTVALWFLFGRKQPLSIVIQASTYIVGTHHAEGGARSPNGDEAINLHALLSPDDPGTTLRWEVQHNGEPADSLLEQIARTRATLRPPRAAGRLQVTAVARRSAKEAVDEIAVEVLPKPPESYTAVRPAPLVPPPTPCPGDLGTVAPSFIDSGPSIPCPGDGVVIAVPPRSDGEALSGAQIWHAWEGNSAGWRRGPMALLRIPHRPPATPLTAVTWVSLPDARCATKARTALVVRQECPPDRLMPDFRVEQIGPSHFRYFAEPARRSPPYETYRWDFGDNQSKKTRAPYAAHQYESPTSYRLATLTVSRDGKHATTTRVVHDRWADKTLIEPSAARH